MIETKTWEDEDEDEDEQNHQEKLISTDLKFIFIVFKFYLFLNRRDVHCLDRWKKILPIISTIHRFGDGRQFL